ncbi:MAG: SDR family oxidoreductase [Oscillospiraceae bacterium]|nr:SDR family oxidoreductase [Oscillospiraceae bacterium]
MIIKNPPIPDMKTAYNVAGKNVVVTGGNRGIGRGITQAFAESGANVAILCRNLDSGKKAVSEIEKFGGKYTAIKCNTANHDEVKTAAAEVLKFFDNIDVIVNNAGVATTTPFLSENGLSEWHRVIDTDLHGPANIIFELAPKMVDAGKGGTIVNITSVGGQRVSGSKEHHNAPYNAAKAGLDIFTRYLAVVLGDYGIRVNSIAPGPIHSDLDKDLPPSFIGTIEEHLPAHRFGEPIEIGALCVYMASPAAAMVTGVNWALDGGLLCVN